MRVFVFEFVAGGGMLGGARTEGSLLREGASMLRAVTADFAGMEGCTVLTTWDARLEGAPQCAQVHRVGSCEEEQQTFLKLAADADGVLVIAPEFDGLLLGRVRQVEELGGRLLSPGSRFVKVASDKHQTGRRLAEARVPTPYAVGLNSGEPLPDEFPYPAVLKPSDGAGSQDVFWIEGPGRCTPSRQRMRSAECGVRSAENRVQRAGSRAPDEFELSRDLDSLCHSALRTPHSALCAPHPALRASFPWRLERFCPGMAASIALLCGPAGGVALPACRQILSDDGRFRYLGGETPLAPPLHRRAALLAQRALDALPPARGYVGVDLVLGAADDGSQDVVIEINPRLTTSYIGLREATQMNLAEVMLQTARSTLISPMHRRSQFA